MRASRLQAVACLAALVALSYAFLPPAHCHFGAVTAAAVVVVDLTLHAVRVRCRSVPLLGATSAGGALAVGAAARGALAVAGHRYWHVGHHHHLPDGYVTVVKKGPTPSAPATLSSRRATATGTSATRSSRTAVTTSGW